MLLQALRPQAETQPTLPGAIRLPEDNDTNGAQTTADGNARKYPLKERLNLVRLVKGWNLRRVTIVGITFATQLGFFIVLMVMKNRWIRYQQPLDSESLAVARAVSMRSLTRHACSHARRRNLCLVSRSALCNLYAQGALVHSILLRPRLHRHALLLPLHLSIHAARPGLPRVLSRPVSRQQHKHCPTCWTQRLRREGYCSAPALVQNERGFSWMLRVRKGSRRSAGILFLSLARPATSGSSRQPAQCPSREVARVSDDCDGDVRSGLHGVRDRIPRSYSAPMGRSITFRGVQRPCDRNVQSLGTARQFVYCSGFLRLERAGGQGCPRVYRGGEVLA